MEQLPGHVASVAPGMTQVIEAGQKYTLVDDNGAELELEGRDRPWVVEFLQAFDEYMDAAGRLGDDNVHVAPLRNRLAVLWQQMPRDLQEQMPSFKTRGVRIETTHTH